MSRSSGTSRSVAAQRVGLFGLLGSGNSGNEASMETVLAYLRAAHPDAVVGAMCGGSDRVRTKYAIDAVPLSWYERHEHRTGPATAALKLLAKVIDIARTMSWVRHHDVVIVPGAGVLEATLPMRAAGFPYAMFLLCLSGRILGTKVALVSVGAAPIKDRATRWLSNSAARLAHYRSYRDTQSREAMQDRGVDATLDHVYPDLVFGAPTPPYDAGDPQTVGLGIMAYYGGNDDRRRADQIHASYVEKMIFFATWLVDHGYKVRLFGGDSKFDDAIARQIEAELRHARPDLGPGQVLALPASSITELMQVMLPVGTVVATRYHNVMCALKLCKPTISIGYSQKFVSLMTDVDLAEFCQFAYDFDVDRLIGQFTELGKRYGQLPQAMAQRNAANARRLDNQFVTISALLFPARARARLASSA